MLIQKATVIPFFSMPSWLGLPDFPTSRPASMACASGWYKWRVPKSGSHGQPKSSKSWMIIIETDRNPRWPGDTPCFRTPRYLPYYHEPKSTWRISTHWKQGFTQQKRWVASLTGWFLDQLLQWICAVRGWSILHAVARSLTSNIFEPSPNSSLPPKRKTANVPVAHQFRWTFPWITSNPWKCEWNSHDTRLIVLQEICQTRLQHTGWCFRGELLVTPPASRGVKLGWGFLWWFILWFFGRDMENHHFKNR